MTSLSGSAHPQWRGGRRVNTQGYVVVRLSGHPRTDATGYVREHIVIVERAMGHPLPPGAQVHHVNGDRADNRNRNLVVCEDQTYHLLLESRGRALRGCGHPTWRRCLHCREWDAPERLYCANGSWRHPACHARHERERQQRKRA